MAKRSWLKEKEYKKAYYQRNKDKMKAFQKARYEADKDGWKLQGRKQRLRKAYFPHLTVEDAYVKYMTMLDEQGGCCAICKKPETKRDHQKGKTCVLAVDHNHETKEVRGLLCFRCNTNLGWFESMGTAFTDYLRKGAL